MRKFSWMIMTVCLGVLAATPALAEGLYMGVGIGNTFFNSDYHDALDQIQEIDENSTAWKIFGGFSGHKFLGVEGGYRNFGKISVTQDGAGFESNTDGFDIEVLGRFQIAIIDIFAKGGLMFWNADGLIEGVGWDDSGSNFLWGLGAGVHLGPIGVRVEWESLEVDHADNLSIVSLGATFGF